MPNPIIRFPTAYKDSGATMTFFLEEESIPVITKAGTEQFSQESIAQAGGRIQLAPKSLPNTNPAVKSAISGTEPTMPGQKAGQESLSSGDTFENQERTNFNNTGWWVGFGIGRKFTPQQP